MALEGYVPCLGVALAGVGAVPALGVVEEEVQGVGAGPSPVAHAHLHEHPDNKEGQGSIIVILTEIKQCFLAGGRAK
jgi:hypothetical protein